MKDNISTIIKVCLCLLLSFVVFFALGYFYKANAPQALQYSVTHTVFVKDTNKHESVKNNFNTVNAYTLMPRGAIDTNAIVNSYFTKRFIADSICDTLIRFRIYDTLYNNNIVYRKTKYELVKPYQTITTTTLTIPSTVSQNGFYAGSFFAFNKQYLFSAGLEANFVTRKINYGLGYDFKNNSVTGKLLFRLK